MTTFKDEATVSHICKEVGQALTVCNRLLKEKGHRPFGIQVSGHTSTESSSSMETSRRRAQAVGLILAEELHGLSEGDKCGALLKSVAKTGRGTMPSGAQIVTMGFSSTRKLAAYDDGENHPENRRVEIELFEADKEEEEVRVEDAG